MGLVGRWQRLGLVAKFTSPFVAVFVAALVLLAVVSTQGFRAAMTASLDKRAEILVTTLAVTLTDPLSMGEVDRLQTLVDEARRADADVRYVVLVNGEGKAVASTDASLRHQTLTRNDFERAMGAVTGFTRRAVPGAAGVFEVAAPVRFQGQPAGVLRIGVSMGAVTSASAAAQRTIGAVGLGALAAGIGVYVWLARRMVRPLRDVVERLHELAGGDADLTRRLPVRTADEVGELAGATNRFLDNLSALVTQIREASVRVTDASERLSAATGRLATGSHDQAAGLQETAASLEQMTATVRRNADSARQANELAGTSRETAERGGRVVEETVGAMSEINRASRRIADITTAIDDIAFQTNLLALNAAVEAARAGEQGRGFAVVAAEVRTLAQRAAAAAGEITGLIRDSVAKVDAGVALVNRSGDALAEIVTAVRRVGDIIAEITAASGEQSTGIDQVSGAVNRMDGVVQASAGETEALSTTADALAGEAQTLADLVGRFTLARAVAAPAAPVPAWTRAPRPALPTPAGRSHLAEVA
jgi:methyl-accepting chemotaxis protein